MAFRSAILAALALLAACTSTPPPPLTDTVQTRSGAMRGAAENGMLIFRGVPYAAPPVGELRWRPPQPTASWAGVRDAREFGAMCVQAARTAPRIGLPLPILPVSEDCLFLNVWTPAKSSGERLPVVVWLHGGNFMTGSGAATDGSKFAQRGIVVVSINYRIGPLGYLAHPALSVESGRGVSGNYGLLDQIAALQWVHTNIAAFGGNPGKVTLMGQSAGATSVLDIITSPLARGLFSQAIVQSGGGSFGSQTSLASEEKDGAALGADIAALRAMPAEEIIAKYPQASAMRRAGHFYPNLDGYAVPKDIQQKLLAGEPAIPMLLGFNSDEGMFWSRDLPTNVTGYRTYLEEWFAEKDRDAVMARYPAATDDRVNAIAAALATDFKIEFSTLQIARGMSKRAPVYLYRFSRVSPAARSTFGGAAHNMEVPYAFGAVTATPGQYEERDQALSEEMVSAWANFIKTGDPNGAGAPQWYMLNEFTENLIEFGDTTRPGFADREMEAFFTVHPPQPEK